MAKPDIIAQLEEIVPTLTGKHQSVVKEAIEKLQAMGEQLEAFKKSLASRYRPSSEKIDPGQLTLDLLGFMSQQEQSNKAASDDDKKDATDRPKKPRRNKRRSKTKLLPIKEKVIPLSEQDKECSCGRTMNAMDYEIRRQIVYERAKIYMLVEKLEKCACGSCKDGVRTAEGTPKPIEGGLASSSLLAHIAVRKTVDAVPVERLGRILAREGAELAPSTLHDWFGFVGEQAGLIAPVAHQMLLASQLISLDDTRLLSKKHDERDGTQRGRLWMYIGDVNRVVVCRYSPDWKGTHPRKVLEGFQGPVQLDGYGGLNPMFKANKTLRRVGCNDHLRRHFVQAFKDGDKRAAPIVEIFRRLYDIEALAKDRGLEPPERLELRQARSRPLWDELGHAIDNIEGQVTKKSALGKGVSYWRKQRPFLEVFLTDGFVPISNIHVEQLIRTVALFRHNSLFVGNTAAGERYADLMTLMLNCALCGANPFDYLRDILDRLTTGWPAKRVADLMPQAWLAAKKGAEEPKDP